VLGIAAGGSALAVLVFIAEMLGRLTVERITDVEWAFQALRGLPGGTNPAWLFRYRGGLVDCWLEEDMESGLKIKQTVAMSQELKDIFESGGFRYGLFLIEYHPSSAALDLSHCAVFAEGTFFPHGSPEVLAPKTRLMLPAQGDRKRAFFLSREGRLATPVALLTWAVEPKDVESKGRPWPQIRLMCGRLKATDAEAVAVPAQPDGPANGSQPFRSE
jgi:hypothetical protein